MEKWLSLGVLMAMFAVPCAAAAPALRDGDIIFHTSRSTQSAAIQRATHSPYSHVGLVLHRDGKPFVFEAIATVRYTPLASWKMRERYGTRVPLEEPVISPAAQFESPLLETVESR